MGSRLRAVAGAKRRGSSVIRVYLGQSLGFANRPGKVLLHRNIRSDIIL
jgi:hypothetical protein